MNRLTARNKDGLAYLVNVKKSEQEVESPYPNTLKCILDGFEKLAQYEDKEELEEKKVSNLKKAIFTLLYDGYDVPDLEQGASDDDYVDYIVSALIGANEGRCPFKCYDCIGDCKSVMTECANGSNLDCSRELSDVWKDFMDIKESEEE